MPARAAAGAIRRRVAAPLRADRGLSRRLAAEPELAPRRLSLRLGALGMRNRRCLAHARVFLSRTSGRRAIRQRSLFTYENPDVRIYAVRRPLVNEGPDDFSMNKWHAFTLFHAQIDASQPQQFRSGLACALHLIPAYCECDNILQTLENVTGALQPLSITHEIPR